jgi:S1-C subfamily serine protease
VVRRIRPVTVTIENWRPPRKGAPAVMASGGSGVIVSSRGHVLTNEHVVRGAEKIWIVLHDGRRVPAEKKGADERGDIALLILDARKFAFTYPKKVDTERLHEGAWVLACGNPFFTAREGRPIVTLGIISGLNRVAPGTFFYGNAIQHDAEINQGNSGGPLFDLNGHLIGINGKIASSFATSIGGPSNSGVGFTIPMHQVEIFYRALLEGSSGGKHGDQLVGLQVKDSRDSDGNRNGVVVEKVDPGSPPRAGVAAACAWAMSSGRSGPPAGRRRSATRTSTST